MSKQNFVQFSALEVDLQVRVSLAAPLLAEQNREMRSFQDPGPCRWHQQLTMCPGTNLVNGKIIGIKG